MKSLFKKSYTGEELRTFDFLRKIKLFEDLSNDELLLFIPHLYTREYKKDEVVFFRDDPSHAIYIVNSGQVTLNIDLKDKFEELATISPGGVFGDNAILENTRRIYTSVVTSEKCLMSVIPQVNIFQIFDHRPKVKAKMLHSFSLLYNQYSINLIEAYKSAYGFFDLRMVYEK